MKITPCYDWVFIKITIEEKIGRLEIPDAYRRKKEGAEVIKIGPEVKNTKVGDKLIIQPSKIIRHTDPAIKSEGEMMAFIHEEDIIAKVTE